MVAERLKNEVVLITGAGSGLGKALALKLAACESRLVLVSRNEDRLHAAAGQVRSLGGDAVAIAADVSNEEEVFRMVIRAEREWGGIDHLVNSAGLGRYNPLELMTPGEIHRLIDVNLKGTIFVTQAVYQRMRLRARGSIVNVLSTAGREGKPRESIYCASKWGVMGFSKALALEARKYGIRITAFCPGGMDTPFWDHEPPERQPNRERFLAAEEAAEAVFQILRFPDSIEVPEMAIRRFR